MAAIPNLCSPVLTHACCSGRRVGRGAPTQGAPGVVLGRSDSRGMSRAPWNSFFIFRVSRGGRLQETSSLVGWGRSQDGRTADLKLWEGLLKKNTHSTSRILCRYQSPGQQEPKISLVPPAGSRCQVRFSSCCSL